MALRPLLPLWEIFLRRIGYYLFIRYCNTVEVIVSTINGSNRNGYVSRCDVGIILVLNLLGSDCAIAESIGCVAGITVNGYLCACLNCKGEGAFLNLRVIAAVITDINTGEVYTALLVVPLRTEGYLKALGRLGLCGNLCNLNLYLEVVVAALRRTDIILACFCKLEGGDVKRILYTSLCGCLEN